LLQHLLIHAAMNMILGHLRFLQLYDIHLVARDLSADDWRCLWRAGRWRGEERWLYAPLIMTERYLGAVAPGEVMALLAQGTPPRLRAFLAGAPLWRLSYCHCLPRSLKEKLAWHRSGRELWLALRHMVLPPLDDPGLLGLRSKDLHPVLAYLSLYWHKVFWVLCRLLRLPLIYRVRGWQ
jgi:hypothetical protein